MESRPLTRLVVKNFQRHEKTVIDLDPQVTVFVGRSRRGKSSVLRAFRWVCRNRPSGTAFVRWGADRCSVTLDDVSRVRGKGVNEYRIGTAKYRAVGSEVPPPVQQLLNTSDLNFQRQLDGPFWFALPPGRVAQELNKVVNLEEIDRAVGIAASNARRAKVELDVCQGRLSAARTEFREAKRADRRARKGRELVAVFEQWAAICDKTASAAFYVEKATELLSARDRLSKAILSRSRAMRLGSKAADATKRHADLAKLIGRYDKLVVSRPNVGDFLSLQKVREEADRIAIDERDLEALITKHDNLEASACPLRRSVKSLTSKMTKVQICQACGRPLTPKTPSASSGSPTYTLRPHRRRHAQSKTGTG